MALALAAAAGMGVRAGEAPEPARRAGIGGIDGMFVQHGTGEEVESVTLGATRHLSLPWLGERTGLYGELSLAQWRSRTHAPRDTGSLVQLGLKPVLRWRLLDGDVHWFAEFGIGLTLSSEIYSKGDRRFSTTFNFGDHVGVGWAFGERHAHEITLRAEHFSNGDLVEPNPGENFREIRYLYWF